MECIGKKTIDIEMGFEVEDIVVESYCLVGSVKMLLASLESWKISYTTQKSF